MGFYILHSTMVVYLRNEKYKPLKIIVYNINVKKHTVCKLK